MIAELTKIGSNASARAVLDGRGSKRATLHHILKGAWKVPPSDANLGQHAPGRFD